jgi:glycosyltransferase involved in cell wall biosynthesis
MRIAIITNFPSYHQVDLFNALHAQPDIALKVFYLRHNTPGRQWRTLRTIGHPHRFISEWRWHKHFYLSPGLSRAVDAFRPDLLIVTQYASIGMQWMMYRTCLKHHSWIYWSEGPGVISTDQALFTDGWIRTMAQTIALLPLRFAGPREVWAIGRRAMDAYARVTKAPLRNVPYYFDQRAFLSAHRGPLSSPVKFLFAGKLRHHKGFDIVVDALQLLGKSRQDFEVVVVGDGPDKSLLDRLSPDIRRLVHLDGFKELNEMPAVFAKCDVLLFPSRYDGWGMTVTEGMASGMAVIASPEAGSARDLIEHGINGLILDELDAKCLASSMHRLLDLPEAIRQMGNEARRRVVSLSAEVGARAIAQFCHEYNRN